MDYPGVVTGRGLCQVNGYGLRRKKAAVRPPKNYAARRQAGSRSPGLSPSPAGSTAGLRPDPGWSVKDAAKKLAAGKSGASRRGRRRCSRRGRSRPCRRSCRRRSCRRRSCGSRLGRSDGRSRRIASGGRSSLGTHRCGDRSHGAAPRRRSGSSSAGSGRSSRHTTAERACAHRRDHCPRSSRGTVLAGPDGRRTTRPRRRAASPRNSRRRNAPPSTRLRCSPRSARPAPTAAQPARRDRERSQWKQRRTFVSNRT